MLRQFNSFFLFTPSPPSFSILFIHFICFYHSHPCVVSVRQSDILFHSFLLLFLLVVYFSSFLFSSFLFSLLHFFLFIPSSFPSPFFSSFLSNHVFFFSSFHFLSFSHHIPGRGLLPIGGLAYQLSNSCDEGCAIARYLGIKVSP